PHRALHPFPTHALPIYHPAQVLSRHGVKARHVFGHALNGFAGEISADQLEALSQDPRIELIEPELELYSTAQTLSTGVKRIGAKDRKSTRLNSSHDQTS